MAKFTSTTGLEPEEKISVLGADEIKRVIGGSIEIESRYYDCIRPGTYIYYKNKTTGKMSARMIVLKCFRTKEKNLLMFELQFETRSRKNTTEYKPFVIGVSNISNIYQEVDPGLKQIMDRLDNSSGESTKFI